MRRTLSAMSVSAALRLPSAVEFLRAGVDPGMFEPSSSSIGATGSSPSSPVSSSAAFCALHDRVSGNRRRKDRKKKKRKEQKNKTERISVGIPEKIENGEK